MKKILTAVFALSMGLGALAGNTETVKLVYDYRASITRIDARYALSAVKVDKKFVQKVTDAYSVAADSIYGYVVLPACKECDPTNNIVDFNEWNETDDALTARAYLKRSGDWYSMRAKSGLKPVVKTRVMVAAGIFGAMVNVTDSSNAPIASIANATNAWMALDILLPKTPQKISGKVILPFTDTNTEVNYGFFGLDNTNAGLLQNTGFGFAQNNITLAAPVKPGWCDEPEGGEDKQCKKIIAITGSTIGYPMYEGPCTVTPMWDLCYNVDNEFAEKNAVVAGTWILRYNQMLSGAKSMDQLQKDLYARLLPGIDSTKYSDYVVDLLFGSGAVAVQDWTAEWKAWAPNRK